MAEVAPSPPCGRPSEAGPVVPPSYFRSRDENVASLLLARETGCRLGCQPVGKHAPAAVGERLESWVERDFLQNSLAEYCAFHAAARSTIASSFSPDGSLVASTQ